MTIKDMTMTIAETRFGTIEYTNDDIVFFDEGLIGFSKLRQFVLLCLKPGSPFRWMQSVEEPKLAFLVADPAVFVSDYTPSVDDGIARELGLDEKTPRLLFTTVSIPPGCPNDMTLNLAAPILINAATQHAKQVVLDDHAYTIKHRVFPATDRSGEKEAA